MEECKLQRYHSQHCGTTIKISAWRAEVVILLSTQAAELSGEITRATQKV